MKWLKNNIIMLIFLLLLISITAINSYYTYIANMRLNQLSQTVDIIVSDNENIKSSNNSITSDIKTLQDDVNNIRLDINSQSSKESTKSLSEIRDELNHLGNNSITSNVNKCSFPNCDNNVFGNSPYCTKHSCNELGCLNHIQNRYGHYCENHTCSYPNCNNKKALNSNYCLLHQE